jgi:hypothetical protein
MKRLLACFVGAAGMLWQLAQAGGVAPAVCIGTAPATVRAVVPTQRFTLAWMHSIEKIRWEEDYQIENGQLRLVVARVRGSGAGMEPPEGSVLRHGVYEYTPGQTMFPKLVLTRSTFTRDYELCREGQCQEFSALIGKPEQGEVVELFPCSAR